MIDYTTVDSIKGKLHKEFTKSLIRKGIPCVSTGIIQDKNNKIKLLEVILDRKARYASPFLLNKIPKTYRGIKVKAF